MLFRSPGYVWGPRHIHIVITHADHPQFISRIFFKRDPRVSEVGGEELAIFLEDGTRDGESLLFGRAEFVLR